MGQPPAVPSQTAQEVGNPWHPCLVHLMTFMQHIISMIALVHAIKEFIIAAFHAEVEIVVARILEPPANKCGQISSPNEPVL